VWQTAPGHAVVATTDSLVEGSHFTVPLSRDDAVDLGWRLLAVSLSDIAAMGAAAGPAFISLAVPGGWPLAWIEGLYRGIAECGARFGVAIAGGNVSASGTAVLTSFCLGTVDRDRVLRRRGARAGDQLAVTGPVGTAAAVLRARGGAEQVPGGWAGSARPSPRLEAGRLLAATGVRVAMDISDGLFIDSGRLLEAAGCTGLVIDAAAIPVAEGVRERWPDHWLEVAGGGEDYELAFVAPPALMRDALRALAGTGMEPAVIGRFDAGQGLRLAGVGGEGPPPGSGHEHFRR
jgi:thiamine-monophosphate kinase